MPILLVDNLGAKGVNVDLDPLHVADNEFRACQNLIADPLGAELALRSRPGFTPFTAVPAAGAILGGIGVPLANKMTSTRFWYLGRGPIT